MTAALCAVGAALALAVAVGAEHGSRSVAADGSCVRPYASTSAWNRPIAAGAAIAQAFGNPQEMLAAFPGGIQGLQALFAVPGRPGLTAFGGGGGGFGGGFGGGGFGGGGAPLMQTGDYGITLKIGNEVQKAVLRLEHVLPTTAAVPSAPEDRRPW